MRKFLIALVGLVLLVVAAVLVVPGFIDWNAYRPQIAARLSALTGRDVGIDGNVKFALLPTPRLTASKISIANAPGSAEPLFLSLDGIDVQVALPPLLTGDLQVHGMTLVRPRLVLERRADGTANWEFGGQGGFSLADVRLDRVSIEDGTVLWSENGHTETLSGIYANLSAANGSLDGAGEMTVRGTPVTVEASVQPRTSSGALPVRLAFVIPDAGASLRYAGLLNLPGKAQGELKAEGADLAAALAVLNVEAPAAAAQPFAASALLSADGTVVGLTDLALRLGESRATGKASVALDAPVTVDATLAAGRLDLDPWLGQPGTGVALPDLGGVRARIDLSADTVGYRGDALRQVQLNMTLADGTLAVDRFAALLPGAATLSADGTLMTANGAPAYDLTLDGNSDDLRTTLRWLGLETPNVPEDRFRTLRLAGRFTGESGRIAARDLDVTLDGQRATGDVALVQGPRPRLEARLTADTIDLDAYRTDGGGTFDWPGLLAGTDGSVDLRAGTLVAGGNRVEGLRLDAALDNGALTLRELSAGDLAGAAFRLEGGVAQLAPLGDVELAYALRTEKPGALLALLGIEPPIDAARLGTVELGGRASGDAALLELGLSGTLAGGSLEIGGSLTDLTGEPTADLKLRVMHPRTAALLGLFVPDLPPAAALGAPTDLYAEFVGGAPAFALNALQGTIAGVPLKGEVTVDNSGDRPRIDLHLTTGDLPLAILAGSGGSSTASARFDSAAPWSTEPLNLGWLQAMDGEIDLTTSALVLRSGEHVEQASLKAGLEDGTLTVESVAGRLYGGRLTGAGRLTGGAQAQIEAEGALAAATLPEISLGSDVGLSGGRMDLAFDLRASGASPAALVGSLDGKGTLALRDNVLSGIDLGAMVSALKSLDEPTVAISSIMGAAMEGASRLAGMDAGFVVEDGVVRTEDARLVAEVGEARIGGDIDLPAWRMDMGAEFRLTVLRDVPPFSLRLVGPLDDPKRRFDTEALQAYAAKAAAEALVKRLTPAAPAPKPPAPAPAPAPEPRPNDGAPPATDAGTAPEPAPEPVPASGPTTEDFIRGILDSLNQR